ncbi:hybrid sensor histidine kinase/response regulator [Haladaptatus salinisoli]|uniref:hybrid sensor histidine kinase/response regulator n=1 Tax=Haladaptatus salinisoli TaxID=2884876 RepID=UPI001D09DDFC|nr:PAS domain-containing protein [Haladaptatus salinisoli]
MTSFLGASDFGDDTPIRVLHVDDDPARVRLSEALLTNHLADAVVHTETDPTAALASLDDGRAVDCVVSDFDMGETNGLDFLETVRDRFPRLPFILFTGKGSEEIASEAISAGVTDYLQKGGGADQYAVLANRIENVVGRYRAERAATEYQERMRNVYERVRDAFFALDAEWRFTYLNERAERLLSRTEEELLGEVVWEEFPDALNSQFEDEYREAMETQEPTMFEAHYPPLDKLFKVHAYPSEEGLSVYFRDVTEANEMRKEHHREKELLERVFETSPVGILVIDSEGEITRANERVVELLEVTEEEITNRTYDSSQWTTTDEEGNPFADGENPLLEVFEEGTTIRDVSMGYEGPSGDWRLLSISAAPIRSADGDLERVVVTVDDVTERRNRQQELEQQNERLEEFASVVSHDLRNPLDVAQVRTDLERRERDSEHLEEISLALDRMDALITDLLTLARQGRVVGETKSLDLSDAVRDAWSITGSETATLDVADDLPTIRADESRLRELLENLLDNAVTHAGDDPHVRVEAVRDGFAIGDDGYGIPPEKRDRIFEDGFSTERRGTGFGLSIVKQIADAHEWTLTAGDDELGGARFEVRGVDTAEE